MSRNRFDPATEGACFEQHHVPSRVLEGGRDVFVWLPSAYTGNPDARFSVLVMPDAGSLFAKTAEGGENLATDEWVTNLSAHGEFPESIIIGIQHPAGMFDDRLTLRDCDLSPEMNGPAFAAFVAGELLPWIDTRFRTIAEPAARCYGGTGLGGAHAVLMVLRHANAFGGVFGLSPSFEDVSGAPPAHSGLLKEVSKSAIQPGPVRLYLDHGTEGLDECYEPYLHDLACLLRESGWHDERDFRIRKVPGGRHDVLSWRERLGEALRFLGA